MHPHLEFNKPTTRLLVDKSVLVLDRRNKYARKMDIETVAAAAIYLISIFKYNLIIQRRRVTKKMEKVVYVGH